MPRARTTPLVPVPLSRFASLGRELREDDASVLLYPWADVVRRRIRSWLVPHGLWLLACFVVVWIAVVARASARGTLQFTFAGGAVFTVGVAAWLWRFYGRLPSASLPVLFRVAVAGGTIPHFQPHLDDGRGVAPVTTVVLLPHGAGLGLVGRDGVFALRQHGAALEIMCAPNGRVGGAWLTLPGVDKRFVNAAGNVRRRRGV